MEEEIKAEFLKSGFTLDYEEEIFKKFSSLQIRLKLGGYYLNRQLDESFVKDAEMHGFLGHLQNEKVEAVVKKEPGLPMYSFKDVDM
ncbi:hypothetical protein CRYUN_Cryun04dG0158400 [Craigia yunnanensis]